MNPGTLPPWLSPWSSGLVSGQHVYRPEARAGTAAGAGAGAGTGAARRLTIFTYGHNGVEPIISFSKWSAEGGSRGGAGDGGSVPPPAGEAGGALLRWQRVHLFEDDPVPQRRHPPRYDLSVKPEVRYSELSEEDTGAEGADGGGLAAWSGVVRGWVAGATLLVLLVLVARLAERFLDWKYMLRQRRRQREWQRANVRATSRMADECCFIRGLEREHPLPAELREVRSEDLPPPYSARGHEGYGGARGDKPPPYSASCDSPPLPSAGIGDPPADPNRLFTRLFDAFRNNLIARRTAIQPDPNSLGTIALFSNVTQAMHIVNSNAVDGTDASPNDSNDAPNDADGANTADDAPNDPDISSNDTDGVPIVTDGVPSVSDIAPTGQNVALPETEVSPKGINNDPQDGSAVV